MGVPSGTGKPVGGEGEMTWPSGTIGSKASVFAPGNSFAVTKMVTASASVLRRTSGTGTVPRPVAMVTLTSLPAGGTRPPFPLAGCAPAPRRGGTARADAEGRRGGRADHRRALVGPNGGRGGHHRGGDVRGQPGGGA